MKMNGISALSLLVCGIALTVPAMAQTDSGVPHLQKQGPATQLIVDGKPFFILAGELGNNAATSLPMMEPFWPRLVAGNTNAVLVGISWAQLEPEEGHFNFTQVDGVIDKAREHHMHIVFLWLASWKNGTSSFAPYWVKKDYTRFPRIQIDDGKTVSISGPVELLSTFGDATRDADAAAFKALMAHIKEVDGSQHTVLMMQVENEVGVLRDSRDRSPAANRAYAGQVPAELMNYLVAHKDHLMPDMRSAWAANGYKQSGTWEEVFGPGKPDGVELPVETQSPPMDAYEHEVAWKEVHWASDEFFMAWNYSRYVDAVAKAGKSGYDIPMYVNGWEQQPNEALPGTFPSGGPLPEVHDIWRAGAPDIDILAPDLYLPYFDVICERWIQNGDPLFIPESGTDAANVIMAAGKYNAIGYSPFGVDGGRPIPADFAATYAMLDNLAPMILAHQGTDTMTAVRMVQGDPPKQIKLGNYTLTFRYAGRNLRLPPQARGGVAGSVFAPPEGATPPVAAAIVISTGPDEYYFAGGGMRVDFTTDAPGPANVGLGVVQTGKFVDGKWELTRWIEGDDDAQGEILVLQPGVIMRVQLYRFP
jgi:hypothetical protein